jgi:FlaA1/EpsC-like NDP-sugar epimerase
MLTTLLTYIAAFAFFYNLYKYVRFQTVKLDFTGKVVLITGGSSGIGEQLCKRFVELNA